MCVKNRQSQANGSRQQGRTARARANPEGDHATSASRSGQIPSGDVRLTANIRSDLHLALKIRAARERTTMGELIEQWVASWQEDD